MTPTHPIDTVAEHLRASLSLLEQLHVLSQTQTLLLESGDLANLGSIVEAKEALVARITESETQLAELLAKAEPGWKQIHELVHLKEEALQLIERISNVERKNRQQLETLRTNLIQRSESLRRDRIIQEAYGQLS